MSVFQMMQPESYCTQCGAPMYLLFNRLCHTCKCPGPAMAAYTYTSSTVPLAERDTTIDLPAIRACDVEEVTSERASRIYQCVYRAIWKHQSSCIECDRLEKIDLMCLDQLGLWTALRFWSKHITDESPTTIS